MKTCLFSFLLLFFITDAICQSGGSTRASARKPNIIFILTDDQRWDALGYAGNPLATTPEMDKLARSGTWFRYAMVTTPICAASRASIITGLYERTHKYDFQTGAIREEYMREAYPRFLTRAGYFTGFFGKFGVKYDKLNTLFDVSDNYDRNNAYTDKRGYFYKTIHNDTVHLTRYTGQQALDFISSAPGDKPFFLQLSFSAPHAHDGAPDQYFWQEETGNLYTNTVMPPPDIAADRYFNQLPDKVKSGFNRLRWTWRFDTPEKYQHSVKGYYRMIAGIDLEIGKIRAQLKKQGIDRNTIIIIMGDNGYFLGERQLAGKWLMYDQSIRVPLIIYDPRVSKHKDVNEMALNVDVPATILDFAGMQRPSSWHGKSLRPFIAGNSSLRRDTVLIEHLWEFDNIPPSEGIRTRDWKYFRYVNDKSIEELYNLNTDPKEINNLARDQKYSQVLNQLRHTCEEMIAFYKDPYDAMLSGLKVNMVQVDSPAVTHAVIPYFSWKARELAGTQRAYQVLVASSKQNIDLNIGDVWNSGQVRSGVSSNISCQGASIRPQHTYFWKVRVWDRDNRLSDYSAEQSFQVPGLAE